MSAFSGLLRLQTEGNEQISDLTDGVRSIVRRSEIDLGVVTVFAMGSTAAVTTMECEPGTEQDLADLLERLIPAGISYEHNRLNGDTNAHAHLRATLIGPSESIPLAGGELALGPWQQIVLLDFDNRPRTRSVAVHVTG
jgi:secondary thiamine-phosphate synthase enzyme